MRGDKVPLAMGALADHLAAYGAVVNASCGMHVHVDAVDFSAVELRRVLVMFRLFQDQIFGTLVDESRRTNPYCPGLELSDAAILNLMKLSSSAEINNWFYAHLYRLTPNTNSSYTKSEATRAMKAFEARLNERKAHKYENGARRAAINFHSWMMRGTIEFRLKEGTINRADLINWPLWCGWFVQKSTGLTDKELLWWMKQPITLRELSERFASTNLGNARMPKSILSWVDDKLAEAKRPKPKKAEVPLRQNITTNPETQRAAEQTAFLGPRTSNLWGFRPPIHPNDNAIRPDLEDGG